MLLAHPARSRARRRAGPRRRLSPRRGPRARARDRWPSRSAAGRARARRGALGELERRRAGGPPRGARARRRGTPRRPTRTRRRRTRRRCVGAAPPCARCAAMRHAELAREPRRGAGQALGAERERAREDRLAALETSRTSLVFVPRSTSATISASRRAPATCGDEVRERERADADALRLRADRAPSRARCAPARRRRARRRRRPASCAVVVRPRARGAVQSKTASARSNGSCASSSNGEDLGELLLRGGGEEEPVDRRARSPRWRPRSRRRPASRRRAPRADGHRGPRRPARRWSRRPPTPCPRARACGTPCGRRATFTLVASDVDAQPGRHCRVLLRITRC